LRLAAIKAVQDTAATFATAGELRDWLSSQAVAERSEAPDWPTLGSHGMWRTFLDDAAPGPDRVWTAREHQVPASWDAAAPPPAHPVRLCDVDGETLVLAADGARLGRLGRRLNAGRRGLLRATTTIEAAHLNLAYFGPADLWDR
jgi:hypothetical protein